MYFCLVYDNSVCTNCLLAWKFGEIQSQNNCVNYIQVCGNQAISLNVSGGGSQEISNSSWCFSQENNSLWLRFTILTGGTLGLI